MGFVSKTIFLTTGVPGVTSSVKQKTLKAQRAQLAEMRKQTQLMQQLADPEATARAAAADQARHEQRVALAAQRRDARVLAARRRQELRDARGPVNLPHWALVIVRAVGWGWAALFAFAAFGAITEGSLTGALVCLIIAAVTVWLLLRTRATKSPTND